MSLNDTKKDASGKWRSILKSLGLTDLQLSDRHQPCPMCEGKDRYRFTDYKGNGDYYCSGCGAGDGFDLLMGLNGWDFKTAAKEVDKLIGNGNLTEVFKPEVDYEKRRKDLNNLWAGGTTSDHLIYLQGRGIRPRWSKYCKDLRGHPGMYFSNDDYRPGMIALVRNKAGTPVSIHRTYTDSGQRKMMPPTEPIAGAAIRLGLEEALSPEGKQSNYLVVGEGIETTLSGMMAYACPGYACISAHGMETVEIPSHVDRVIILADNDRSFTGQKAAFTLARRLDQANKKVLVVVPPTPDTDFNDVRNADEMIGFENDR